MHPAIMKAATRAALVALAPLASGCVDRGRAVESVESNDGRHVPAPAPDPRGVEGRGVDAPVVILTIDGVRWQEVFGGTDPSLSPLPTAPASAIAPNLHRLGSERGAFVGAPGYGTIAASGPNYISLPGYTELLSGRPSVACTSNECSRTTLPTVLDEARAAGAKVAAFASWDRLSLAATTSPGAFRVSCGRDGDHSIEPWPGHGDYRPDRTTADLALAYYQAEEPDVFFLGLGDPDEYAHRGDYARYVTAIQQADDVLGRLLDILDRAGERGKRTHVIVTADHGRAYDFRNHGGMPEAARVWMVASGPRFFARGATRSTRERRLADVVPTLRLVLGLTPDTSKRAGTPLDELFASEPYAAR
jgi:hypothetical protein